MNVLAAKLISTLLIAALISQPAAIFTGEFSHETAATSLSLILDFGNGTVLDFYDLEGTNVLNVTESVTEVEMVWYGDLVFVTSIAGVSNNESGGLWWQYWVNDELGPVAANKYQVQDGDAISWRRILPETEPTDQPIDYTLIGAAVVLAVIGFGFLFFLSTRKAKE
ncbi:MAG: DUF4430 domain-containing protein [Candidatus Thorarchaeota archaeon]|nr:DUF4430 domain-containing protein [Candidatus Thorarchaeota archaeon]